MAWPTIAKRATIFEKPASHTWHLLTSASPRAWLQTRTCHCTVLRQCQAARIVKLLHSVLPQCSRRVKGTS